MVVGVLQFELHIHGAESLKDKRRVVRSLKDRLHREHQVSVSEVASQDNPAVARLALALAAPDATRAAAVLDQVSTKLRTLLDAELGAIERSLLDRTDLTVQEQPIDEAALAAELLDYACDGGDTP